MKSTRSLKIVFYALLGIFAMMMTFSGIGQLAGIAPVAEMSAHLGIPFHLLPLLGGLKVLGALALVLPFLPKLLKSYAFAGFTFLFIGAGWWHLGAGDPISKLGGPLFGLVFVAILQVLYYTRIHVSEVKG